VHLLAREPLIYVDEPPRYQIVQLGLNDGNVFGDQADIQCAVAMSASVSGATAIPMPAARVVGG
jgi:hypothetical protein